MSDTNLRPGVFDDTMPRRGIVKSNDLPHLEVVIADKLIVSALRGSIAPLDQDPPQWNPP
jgi:hypothetical protein